MPSAWASCVGHVSYYLVVVGTKKKCGKGTFLNHTKEPPSNHCGSRLRSFRHYVLLAVGNVCGTYPLVDVYTLFALIETMTTVKQLRDREIQRKRRALLLTRPRLRAASLKADRLRKQLMAKKKVMSRNANDARMAMLEARIKVLETDALRISERIKKAQRNYVQEKKFVEAQRLDSERQKKNNKCLHDRLISQEDRAMCGWAAAREEKKRRQLFEQWYQSLPESVQTQLLRDGLRRNARKAAWSATENAWVSPRFWDPGLSGKGRWT